MALSDGRCVVRNDSGDQRVWLRVMVGVWSVMIEC